MSDLIFDAICPECLHAERSRPDYIAARLAETEAARRDGSDSITRNTP
jgi:hypothetical protein